MVTRAQPLMGMPWLMVRIFPPETAKLFRTADSTPGSSRSMNWKVTIRPWSMSLKGRTASLYL